MQTKLVKNVNGQVKVLQPREEAEKRKLRTGVFHCKCNQTGKILNPLLDVIRPPFQSGWTRSNPAQESTSSAPWNLFLTMRKRPSQSQRQQLCRNSRPSSPFIWESDQRISE